MAGAGLAVPGAGGRRPAFTLLEMIISIGLFVVLMSMTYWFYRSSLGEREAGIQASRNTQLARVVLNRIADEVRQAVGYAQTYGPGVYGFRDRIEVNSICIPDKDYTTGRNPRKQQRAGQFDIQQVRYYVAWDDVNVDSNGDPVALGLVRRENRTYLQDVVIESQSKVAQAMTSADAESGEEEATVGFKQELYAPEIKYLEFRYFDGARWWDKWDLAQGNGLPQLVQITIGFIPVLPEERERLAAMEEEFKLDDEDLQPLPEDRYTMFVRIPQADVFFGSRLSREASAFGDAAAAGGLE